jgi:hypothetical protein
VAVSQSDREALATPAGAFSYPDHITLSPGAERYLERLAVDLELGNVELRQLSPALTQLYVLAFERGAASRQGELDAANADADRLYAEVCRRTPPRTEAKSFSELLRARGDDEGADRRTAHINDIFPAYAPEPNSETENP